MHLREIHQYIIAKKAASKDEILAETGIAPELAEGMLITLLQKGKIQEILAEPSADCGGCGHKHSCGFASRADKICGEPLSYYVPMKKAITSTAAEPR
jgi:hypothetical protein